MIRTCLVIRHAEKPESGGGLSPEGKRHAREYVDYFKDYEISGHRIQLDYLVAAADHKKSLRPRITLEPLSKALDLPIDTRFNDEDVEALARELRKKDHGRHVLICWRFPDIPELLAALGADPYELLPEGVWPVDEYDWVIQLSYDKAGDLIPSETRRR